MINGTCPICLDQEAISFDYPGDGRGYECNRCGKFILSGRLSASLLSIHGKFDRNVTSFWIRKNQTANSILFIDGEKFDFIQNNVSLPRPSEQADNFIIFLAENSEKFGQIRSYKFKELASTIGTNDAYGVRLLVDFLRKKEFIKVPTMNSDTILLGLTFEGWGKYEELQKVNKESRFAFMAMQYGNTQLDRIFSEIIKPTVVQTGFDIRRLDEKPEAGLIDDRLRVEIRRSKFLVADLTHENKGAYWEAGFAEGLGLKVIYICEKSVFENPKTKPHFDTDHHLTLKWENTPEGLQEFSEELKAVIRNTFPNEAKMGD